MATTPCTLATFPSDPVLGAIGVHRAAWIAFAQATPETADGAAILLRGTLANLLGTPCTTRAGAESLLRHLRACLAVEESASRLDARTAYVVAARIGDLVRLLERPNVPAPVSLGEAASRVVRSLATAGEAVAALVLIAGGAVLTSLATLL